MSGCTRRTNRVALVGTGAVLIGAGLAALGPDLGWYGSPRTRILSGAMTRWVQAHSWWWPASAAAAVVIGLLGLRWLTIQIRIERLNHLSVEPDRAKGETIVLGDALAEAVEADVGTFAGVVSVSARLAGDRIDPELHLVVDLEADARTGPVRRRIAVDALPHLRAAIEVDRVPTWVTFRFTSARAARSRAV